MPEPLMPQPAPDAIHAIGLRFEEPINAAQYRPEGCALAGIIVPSAVTIHIGESRLFFPVGTYETPIETTTNQRIMQPDNTFIDRPVKVTLAGRDDASMHYYLRLHGAKHTGQITAPPAPPASPPAPPPLETESRVEVFAPPRQRLDELLIAVERTLVRLSELIDRFDAAPSPRRQTRQRKRT